MIRHVATAAFLLTLIAPAQAGQRATTIVGGPYKAVMMAGENTQQVLGGGLSKALFDADFTLLTTSEREIVLSKTGVTPSTLPIPVEFAVRFAEAILKGIASCNDRGPSAEQDSYHIDNWSWTAVPITRFGKRDARPMNLTLVSERSSDDQPCTLELRGEGAFPKTFITRIVPVQAQRLFEDLARIENAARTLDALETGTDGMLDGLH